jgi:6-phosphogluconolactonase
MGEARQTRHAGEMRVYADFEQLAVAGAELFVAAASESVSARGRFRVALSGGATPRRVYEVLAMDQFRSRVDWERVDVFWGDERYVPADHPDSNYRMAAEALLRKVAIPAANVCRVPTDISPATAVATAYEAAIRKSFGEDDVMPRFDLIYLGLGTNGHTASLFPYSQALHERTRLVVADLVAELNAWRITMTAPLLNRGRTVAFVIAGQQKAGVFRELLLGPRDPHRLPAQLINPEGHLLWLVDAAAAALIPEP